MANAKRKSRLNSRLLIILILSGLLYSALLHFKVQITGQNEIDGILGVMLSLYISSHPAANVLDLLFFARDDYRRGLSNQAYAAWWVLNAIALLVGWLWGSSNPWSASPWGVDKLDRSQGA